jgi:hypothetical protein
LRTSKKRYWRRKGRILDKGMKEGRLRDLGSRKIRRNVEDVIAGTEGKGVKDA